MIIPSSSRQIFTRNCVDTDKIRLLGYGYDSKGMKIYDYAVPLKIDLMLFLSKSEFFKIDKLRAKLINVPQADLPNTDFDSIVRGNLGSLPGLLKNVDEVKINRAKSVNDTFTDSIHDIDLTNQISNENISKVGQLTDEEVFGSVTETFVEEVNLQNQSIQNIETAFYTTEDGRTITGDFSSLNNNLLDMGIDPASSFVSEDHVLSQKDLRYGVQSSNKQKKFGKNYEEIIKSSLRAAILKRESTLEEDTTTSPSVRDLVRVYEKKRTNRIINTFFEIEIGEKYFNRTNNNCYILIEAIDVLGIIRDTHYFSFNHEAYTNDDDLYLSDIELIPTKYGINEDRVRIEVKNNSPFPTSVKLYYKTNNENSNQVLNVFEPVCDFNIDIPPFDSRFVETNSDIGNNRRLANSLVLKGKYEKTVGSIMYRAIQVTKESNLRLSNITHAFLRSKIKEVNKSVSIAGYLSTTGFHIYVSEVPQTATSVEILKRLRASSSGNSSGEAFISIQEYNSSPLIEDGPFSVNREFRYLDENVAPGAFYEYKVRLHNYDGTYVDSIQTFGDYYFQNSGVVNIEPNLFEQEDSVKISFDMTLNENSQLKSIVESLSSDLNQVFLNENENIRDLIGNTLKVAVIRYDMQSGEEKIVNSFNFAYNPENLYSVSEYVDEDIDTTTKYLYRFIPYVRNVQDIINDLRTKLLEFSPDVLNDLFPKSSNFRNLFAKSGNRSTFLYSTSGKYNADYLFDNDTIVDDVTYVADSLDGDFYKKGRTLDERGVFFEFASIKLKLFNTQVRQLKRINTTVFVSFEFEDQIGSVDYFIITCEKEGKEFIVGSAHSFVDSNEINFIDETQKDHLGVVKYYATAVYQNGNTSGKNLLSTITLNAYDPKIESMKRRLNSSNRRSRSGSNRLLSKEFKR